MIRLSFAKKHKSILSFPTTDLPADFVVITGINGSGKSHLLEAIENGSITVDGIPANAPNIRRFHHSNMNSNDPPGADPTQTWAKRTAMWQEISNIVEREKSSIRKKLLAQGIPKEQLIDLPLVSKWSISDIHEIIGDDEIAAKIHGVLLQCLNQADERLALFLTEHTNRPALLKTIRQSCDRSIALTEESFYEHVPLDWNPTDVFRQNFAALFVSYYRQREQNKINRYYATQEGKKRRWVEDEIFVERFGNPPWETVNDILAASRLPIRVNHPTGTFDQPFTLKLRHTEFDCDVAYADLSSGEKIIISLAHCLYYAHSGNSSLTLPELLLLDEPDAPLHPTMAKSFMDAIDHALVQDRGVKVIMTTHSPSTVAFAPEGAIHSLDSSPRQLRPSSRESAISVLTDGFATVMPSTRFVIVEAEFDQITYQNLFRTISNGDSWQNATPLVFVRASDQNNQKGGGCGQVSNWAEKLTNSGLTFFRGILDRDAGNEETDVVLVLGRYSIENYLLDPIIIYAYFVERNWHGNVLHLDELTGCNVHLLADFSNEKLQKIADAIFTYLEQFRPTLTTNERFDIHYRNGRSINAPTWVRDYRGHDLATIVRNCFQEGTRPLFSKNLDELALMLNAKLPGFISADLEELFVKLAH